MGSSYEGITLEGEDYKIKILCKDFAEYKRAINFLQKEEQPFIAKGLVLLLKGTEDLVKDYDIFERLVRELSEC
jgi:hypothetical protein